MRWKTIKVTNDVKDIECSKVAVALGTFDGMHIGHMELIKTLKEKACEIGVNTLVYTFSSVPAEYFSKGNIRLFTVEQKLKAFEMLGVDCVLLNEFNKEYAQKTAEQFFNELTHNLKIGLLVAGENFTFGHKKQGNFEMLKKMSEKAGIPIICSKSVYSDGELVSSTRIRSLISKGDVFTANKLLMNPYSMSGIVENGQKLATSLGFATANIEPTFKKVMPKLGVYITTVNVDSKELLSITNVGIRPTVAKKDEVIIETHILNASPNLYKKEITVSFIKNLRGEKKFSSVEKLKNKLKVI